MTTITAPVGSVDRARQLCDRAVESGEPVILYYAMRSAAGLITEHDIRDEVDPDHKRFQIDQHNWSMILEHYGVGVPRVILRHDSETGLPIVREPDGSVTRPRNASVPRPKVQTIAVPNKDDDGATITCTGPCGQRQAHQKFPTLKGGGRGSVCRACETAGRAERKSGQ